MLEDKACFLPSTCKDLFRHSLSSNLNESGHMIRILVVFNRFYRTDATADQLAQQGFTVHLLDVEMLDLATLDPSMFDMAVISLYPDVLASWSMYRRFKQSCPYLPALVHMRPDTLDSLTAAIEDIYRISFREVS